MTAVRDVDWKAGKSFEAFYCDGKPAPRNAHWLSKCQVKIEADDLYGIHEAFKKFGKPAGWYHLHGRHICPGCYGSGFGRGFRNDAFDKGFIERRREELGFGHPYNDRPGRNE